MNIKNLDVQEFLKSKTFKKILIGLGVFIIALFVFQAGIFVGYRKASFSYKWGDNYTRTFGGDNLRNGGRIMGMMGPWGPNSSDFSNAHGTIGNIVKIDLPAVVVLDQNKVEKIILISGNTQIRNQREAASSSDLKLDDTVVVIGSPNDKSQIEARLIRIMPSFTDQAPGTVPARR